MSICNKKELTKAIDDLDKLQMDKEDILLHNIETIKNSFDPVLQLNKLLANRMNTQPQLFDQLIDQSIEGATNFITNKAGLGNDSFIKRKANSLLQDGVYKVFNNNRYKIKAIVSAILKNISPLTVKNKLYIKYQHHEKI